MSISLRSRPIKSSCNWNAAGNPVIFKLRRDDHTIDLITDNAGFAQIQINGVDLTSYYEAGDTIILLDAVTAQTVTTTVATSTLVGSDTVVDVNSAYTSSTFADVITNLSKRTDWKVSVDFKRGVSPNDSLLDSVTLKLSHGLDAIVYADASILKSLLTPDWEIPSGTNEEDEGAYLPFYISYQEYYDGALQGSVTNDSSNIIYLTYGANQIGHVDGSNMLQYYPTGPTKLFITRLMRNSTLQGLKLWKDWPFNLNFIWPNGVSDIRLRRIEINEELSATINTRTTLTPDADTLQRLLLPTLQTDTVKILAHLASPNIGSYSTLPIDNGPFTSTIDPWVNAPGGVGSSPFSLPPQGPSGIPIYPSVPNKSWSYSSNTILFASSASGDVSDIILTALTGGATFEVNESVVRLNMDLVLAVGKQVRIRLMAWDGNQNDYSALDNLGVSSTVTGTGSTQSIQVVPTDPFCSVNKGKIVTYQYIGFTIETINSTSGNIVVESASFELAASSRLTNTVEVTVAEACDYEEDNLPIPWQNPIMLIWRNSAGGDSMWLFDKFHESTYTYNNGSKATRIVLFAKDLDPVQWEALQELNTLGDVYKESIADLENTNTINKTHRRVGAEVYMIDQDGNKKGVIVIPQTDKIRSRNTTHQTAIEIELPEVQAI